MSASAQFVLQLADPRGRSDRTDFVWAAVTLFAAQAAFALGLLVMDASFVGWRGALANIAFCWLGYAAISRRLHDTGRSSWWLLSAIMAWLACAVAVAVVAALVAGPDALEMGTRGFWLTFAVLMLPPLGLALWLHLAEGESCANRYGPVPTHDFSDMQHA